MYEYLATVERVIDGDTLDVVMHLGFKITTHQRLRLADVDTPETWRPKTLMERVHGEEAKDYVKNLIEGEDVIITTSKTGKYGRYIAHVRLPNSTKTINELLVENDLVKLDSYSDE